MKLYHTLLVVALVSLFPSWLPTQESALQEMEISDAKEVFSIYVEDHGFASNGKHELFTI